MDGDRMGRMTSPCSAIVVTASGWPGLEKPRGQQQKWGSGGKGSLGQGLYLKPGAPPGHTAQLSYIGQENCWKIKLGQASEERTEKHTENTDGRKKSGICDLYHRAHEPWLWKPRGGRG